LATCDALRAWPSTSPRPFPLQGGRRPQRPQVTCQHSGNGDLATACLSITESVR
jgi:hypothetical protein